MDLDLSNHDDDDDDVELQLQEHHAETEAPILQSSKSRRLLRFVWVLLVCLLTVLWYFSNAVLVLNALLPHSPLNEVIFVYFCVDLLSVICMGVAQVLYPQPLYVAIINTPCFADDNDYMTLVEDQSWPTPCTQRVILGALASLFAVQIGAFVFGVVYHLVFHHANIVVFSLATLSLFVHLCISTLFSTLFILYIVKVIRSACSR